MVGLLCGRAIGASGAPKAHQLEPLSTRNAEKVWMFQTPVR